MAMQKTAAVGIAVAVAGIMMLTSVLALLQSNRSFSNNGTITTVNVGAYQDSGCTQVLSTIDWGNVVPGSSSSRTIYVKNTGNTQISLNMTLNTWNPSNAASYMNLTWNQENTVLNVGNNVAALLVLSVSASVTGITSFSFNATITGTQV
jgi:hypothetical protein